LPTSNGLGPYVKAHADTFSFIVVFPQNENVKGRILTGWSADSTDGKRAIAILGEVEKQFNVDKSREILTGYSQGGYGAWSLALATPQRWAAVIPVAGGGNPASASS
jgi:predicted peptidase